MMEESRIREQVKNEIMKWTILQENRQVQISFSPRAIDFLCLMIENIQEDKSQYWKFEFPENDVLQEFAISLIPNALNELIVINRFSPLFKRGDIKISSWEIWHSLTKIIDRFCFIPKKI